MEIGVNSGMVDGGANIGITSYEVARLYGRVVREYKRPLVISGVGGIETQAYHFADFGPILGNMALLHSASVTIISVSAITQRGFVVLYDATSVRLVDEKGKVLLGEYDPDTKLFYIDIGSVLRHTNSDEMVETNEEMSSQMEGASVNEAKTTAKRKSKRGEMIAKWLVEAVFDLHNRLSHPAARIMSKAVQDRAWIGVHPDITPAVIDKVFEKRTCLPCALGKMHRLVTPVGSGVRETVPGRRLSYDILGKISPATYNNGHFVHLFVCEAVGFLCKYVTKNKNRFTAANCVAATVAFFAQHGHKVAEIKFDAGATENSDYLKMCFAELTIAPHPIAFDTQRQNTVERYAQTCYQRVATVMLNQMVLGASTWGHALDVDIETLNCTPNELTGADTPYFLVTGRRPDVSRMFKFGFGQLLSCYDSEQESFSKGVLAVSLGWGQGNGATYVIIPGRGLRRFERYDVVPVKVSILQATASQIEGAQPRTAADGSTEFFSPVTSEIDQSFVATYGRHGGAPSRNISETAAGALDPSISGPLESSSTGSGEHKQAPAMRVLDKVHQMMQDMWRSCVMLVENEADLTADEEPKARAAGGEELSSEDLSMDDPSEKGVVVVGSDGEPALGEIVGMSGERENGAVVDHDLQVEDEMQAVMDDGSEDKSRRRPEKPSFEKPVTRSQTRPKASGAKGHVAMEKRVLEMTETRPQPFAFAFSARKWSTADNRNALSPPLLKQVFGAHWREDLTFEENLAGDVLSVGASHETPRSPDWIEGMKMKAIADAAVFVARVKATRSRRHDEDNPTLAQGLAFDPGKWGEAIKAEIDGLKENDVGVEVPRSSVPKECQILNMMIILKIKRSAAMVYEKHKARCVVLGNREWKSVEEVTFAPTASENSVMLLFSLAAAQGLSIKGFDITAAFTYSVLDEAVYVQLPPQFLDKDGQPIVWKLKKSLYGLRRAPRAWFDTFTTELLGRGYRQSPQDPCVFTRKEGKEFVHLALHVDDVISASNSPRMQAELTAHMREKFKLTESESLENVLGFHIDRNDDGSLQLTQPASIQQVIDAAFPEGSGDDINDAVTPMSATFNDEDQSNSPACDKTQYLSLIGQLIWICRTRPDIAYAVNRLSTRSSECTVKDYAATKRVVRYVKFTRRLGITFHPSSAESDEAVRLIAWADAAYCVHKDSKSHSGYCFGLGDKGGKFMSKSSKPATISLSSTEAELDSALSATKQAMWLRDLLAFLGHPQAHPTLLHADNTSMITLASNFSGQSKRMRHCLQKVHFMMEQVHNSVVRLAYLRTEDHTADILTKPLAPSSHWHHVGPLLGEHSTIETAKEQVVLIKGRAVCFIASIGRVRGVSFAKPMVEVAPTQRVDDDERDVSPKRPSQVLTEAGMQTSPSKRRHGTKRQCFEFRDIGTCDRGGCLFKHDTMA